MTICDLTNKVILEVRMQFFLMKNECTCGSRIFEKIEIKMFIISLITFFDFAREQIFFMKSQT